MGDLIGIDEMTIRAARNVARCNTIESVSIDERIAFGHFRTVISSCRTQFFIISDLGGRHLEITAHNRIHENRNTAALAGFANISFQIVIKGRTWFCMAVRLILLVIMTKLDNDIVTGLYEV